MTDPQPARQLPPRRWVTIREVERVRPRVVRIRVQGESLADFAVDGLGAHIKLILPPPGEARPTLPLEYRDGRPIFPDGVQPPFLRTYTPLRFNAETLELDVELVLHGDGLASNWARGAAVGQEIVVAGPRGGWKVPQDGDWYVIAADDTAIPAASEVLPLLPKPPFATFLEVADADDERDVRGAAPDALTWLHRGTAGEFAGVLLERSIAALTLPPGRGYVWVGCEAVAMRRIRRHLIDERGLSSDQMVTRGYWRQGAIDHPDGDYGVNEL